MTHSSSRKPSLGTMPTLRDVAHVAGVHPSTASRALNEATRPLVNASTVGRVLDAAEQLGYQPNSMARGLKMSRTFTAGMIVPDLTNPLFPPMARGIEDGLQGSGYTLVIANTDNDLDKERAIVEALVNRRVDGLAMATARRHHGLLQELDASGVPYVLVNRSAEHASAPSVVSDDHAGIGLAVRHLIGLGHRRIAHVAGPQQTSTGFSRHRSFRWWMDNEGAEFDPDLVVFADWFQEEPGARAMTELLDRQTTFTALVAANDLIALGCYDVLRERDVRVPDDVSIVGYNDIPFADQFNPPLTTVRIGSYEIGLKGAELLLEAIRDQEQTSMSVPIPPSLVVRRSTCAPSTGSR
jgi:LacI family transcriptional regulator